MRNNIELYKEGYSIEEISSMNKLTEEDIKNLIDSVSYADMMLHKENLKKRVIELNANGLSANAISKTTAVSLSIVKDFLSEWPIDIGSYMWYTIYKW